MQIKREIEFSTLSTSEKSGQMFVVVVVLVAVNNNKNNNTDVE